MPDQTLYINVLCAGSCAGRDCLLGLALHLAAPGTSCTSGSWIVWSATERIQYLKHEAHVVSGLLRVHS
ncbi:hypothetical protein WOLCODRAFT_141184 [Wolfiporia cocos MD-104 SS10]|uniref:Uncharacterized protein n=1 Tax=Wolfiporia cocos (strain MD-104) TaxID=742152 RepID=A0A2H3JHK7_WOLCO|nr:hypothetical protein WOLCODRAFT_141184 [Wolfiporia cocos MD-104 SS10]